MIHAFLCAGRTPVTIQAHSHLKYEEDIKRAYKQYWPTEPPQNEYLYGIVYYFHKKKNSIDADNLCKPIFDALKNELYPDDKLIKYVRSAVYDLDSNNIETLDLTKMPDNVSDDFIKNLNNVDDMLYIEIGNLDFGMFEFACER